MNNCKIPVFSLRSIICYCLSTVAKPNLICRGLAHTHTPDCFWPSDTIVDRQTIKLTNTSFNSRRFKMWLSCHQNGLKTDHSPFLSTPNEMINNRSAFGFNRDARMAKQRVRANNFGGRLKTQKGVVDIPKQKGCTPS